MENRKKKTADKPIDEELLMRMMAGETGQDNDAEEEAAPKDTARQATTKENTDNRRRKGKQPADYEASFLKGMDVPARYGKPVYVRREYHERIAKISVLLTGGKVSISAYIDNVLAQHFEQFREDIEAAYNGKIGNLF